MYNDEEEWSADLRVEEVTRIQQGPQDADGPRRVSSGDGPGQLDCRSKPVEGLTT